MHILNVIIVCIPFCFCRELQNLKVERLLHRLRRASEKERANEPKRIRKDNQKFNLQLVPMSTGRQAKQQNLPRLVPVITKVISNNKIGERREPVSSRPKLFQVAPRSFGHAKLKPMEPTAFKNKTEKKLPKLNEVNSSQPATKPKQFIEDSGDDIQPTDQPQYTTPPQNVDSQIEKPINKDNEKKITIKTSIDNKIDVKEQEKPLEVSKRKKLGESTNKSKNNNGNQVLISTIKKTNDSKPVSCCQNPDDVTLSTKETTATKSIVDTKPEAQKQNVNVIQDDKKPVQKIKENTLSKLLKDTQNFKKDDLKIVPSTVLNTMLLSPKGNDSIQGLEPTSQKSENKNVADNSISALIKNETIDIKETELYRHTEIVEKQLPTNDLVANDYPNPQSNVQQYGKEPKDFYDTYKPDTTHTPPPYEYPFLNQFNVDNCHYKTRGILENNSGLTPEAETAKSTFRSWFNTEVIIEKSRNKPVDIQMKVPPTMYYRRPVPNNYYNNFGYGYNRNAYDLTYSSYPYYVYSKASYALSKCN